jgi:hypothetical protein
VARAWPAAVAAIALGALALRVTALDFGLPAVYNPDEVAIMSRALAFAKGDLNPHNFVYPTFYFYVLFGWIGGLFGWQWLTGTVASAAEFQARFFVDPTSVYFAGRLLSAIAGAATVAVVALLGRATFDRATGLVAAAFLAVAPLAVQDAHYVKHDVPVTLVITLALWLMARCWREAAAGSAPSRTAWFWPAAATGVAWSMHYYAVFLGIPLALTAGASRGSDDRAAVARTALALFAIAAAVFFALSPFLLVEPATALRDIVANRQIVVDRAIEAGYFGHLGEYLALLARPGLSMPICASGVIGAFLLAWRRPRTAALLLAFPVAFLLFIANTVPASRYLNPILPVVAVLAAHTLAAIATRYPRPGTVLGVLGTVMAANALGQSVELVRFFGRPDTRTLAREVVEREAAAGSTVLVQPYSVPLHESREGLTAAVLAHAGSLDRVSTKSRLRLATSPWPHPAYRLLWLGEGGLDDDKIYVGPDTLAADPIRVLREQRIDYVVLKGFDGADPRLEPVARALAARGTHVASITPYRAASPDPGAPFLHNTDATLHANLARPGPPITIFRVPQGEAVRLQ